MTDKSQFSKAIRNLRRVCDTPDSVQCRINVVLFGDFFQLPPVRGVYLFEEPKSKNFDGVIVYSEEESSGYMFWLQFEEVIILDENMRQNDDKVYGPILKRLPIGNISNHDLNLLNTRVWRTSSEHCETKHQLKEILRSQSNMYTCVYSNENRHAINRISIKKHGSKRNNFYSILCLAEFNQAGRSKITNSVEIEELFRLRDEKWIAYHQYKL